MTDFATIDLTRGQLDSLIAGLDRRITLQKALRDNAAASNRTPGQIGTTLRDLSSLKYKLAQVRQGIQP